MNARAREQRVLRAARLRALSPADYVGQESFMPAGDVTTLAEHARVDGHCSVLDLCCGTGGPGLLLARRTGCRYLGVDVDGDAVAVARSRAGGLPCRYRIQQVPPLPPGQFDVILLLETMLAFPDKRRLLAAVAVALHPAGRFACTLEEGPALDAAERAAMPRADTVWPVRLERFTELLGDVGLSISWWHDDSARHRRAAERLAGAFEADRARLADSLGPDRVAELITGHRRWAEWLGSGRIRKLSLVAVLSG